MKTKKGRKRKPRKLRDAISTVRKEIKKKRSMLTQPRRNMINFFAIKTAETENPIGRARSARWIKYLVTFINRYSKDIDEQDINDWLKREPSLADPSTGKMFRNGYLFDTDVNTDFPRQWHGFFKELTDDAKCSNAYSIVNLDIPSCVPLPTLENSKIVKKEEEPFNTAIVEDFIEAVPYRMMNLEDMKREMETDSEEGDYLSHEAPYDSPNSNRVSPEPCSFQSHEPALLPITSSIATNVEMNLEFHHQEDDTIVIHNIEPPIRSPIQREPSVSSNSDSTGPDQESLPDFLDNVDMDITTNETGEDVQACDGEKRESPMIPVPNADENQQITFPQNQNELYVQQMEYSADGEQGANLTMDSHPLRRSPPLRNLSELTDFSKRPILNSNSSNIDVETEDSLHIPVCRVCDDEMIIESPMMSVPNANENQRSTFPQNQDESNVQQMEHSEEEAEKPHIPLPMDSPPLRSNPPPTNWTGPNMGSILNPIPPISNSSNIDVGIEEPLRTARSSPNIAPQNEEREEARPSTSNDYQYQYHYRPEPLFLLRCIRAAVGENTIAAGWISMLENYIENVLSTMQLVTNFFMSNRYDSSNNDHNS